ncbi:hypothetical protein [Nocardioides insulae]|uniref:hypothetical protein n=1 Tax=Nocardioides insulae TaxID=394734 RepID=UPI0004012880|nr:hypothetical protein [Nocardioides insulae]
MRINAEKMRAAARRLRPRSVVRTVSGREAMSEIQRLRRRVDGIGERTQASVQGSFRSARAAELASREVNRLAPQLAALETKVEQLRLSLRPVAEPDSAELEQARGLVEAIQEEHRRIRVRLSEMTRHEERMRRIEEKLGLPHD